MTSKPGFLRGHLGAQRWAVFRLGLAATYRPGEETVRCALDHGVNYLFAFGIDSNITRVVGGMNADRRRYGAYVRDHAGWFMGH